MGYYRNRGRYRSWSSRSYAPSQYSQLVNLFGGAVGEIKRAFFALDDDALDALLEDYSALYGDAAGRYARKTFWKWKSGATTLSGQTMHRLVGLVPPYLSSEQRFSLLQQVLKQNKPSKSHKSIRINIKDPAEGFTQLESTLETMRHKDVLAYVPERVMQAASWLYDDDITAARAMLAEAEHRENDLIRSNATREIELLRRTISTGQVQAASYSVKMPTGELNVVAYTPSKCFVATVCFGENAPETVTLRKWRDEYLIEKRLGRKLTVLYYKNGEKLAELATYSPVLKAVAKTFIRVFSKAVAYTSNRRIE